MKVYIVTKESFPNGMAATKRIKNYASGLIANGVDCEIVVAKRTEVYGLKPKNICGEGVDGVVPYRYIGGTPLRDKNIFVRKFNDYKDEFNTLRYLKRNLKDGDIVFNYMRENTFNKDVIKVCKSKGVKVFRELCEYPYGTITQTEDIKRKQEKYLVEEFPKFDGFVAISQALYDLAMKYKRADASVIKVPIMVYIKTFTNDDAEVEEPAVPYIFHSGTLSNQKDGVLAAIEAFGITKQNLNFAINYIFTGSLDNAQEKESIKELIAKYKLEDSIKFTGYLSDGELMRYQQGCSMMIINKQDNLQNRHCFASKLGEYLMTGKPVITTSVGESIFFLKDGVSAHIVSPNDINCLAQKIEYIFNHKEENLIIGSQGKVVALNNFSHLVQCKRLATFFNSLNIL